MSLKINVLTSVGASFLFHEIIGYTQNLILLNEVCFLDDLFVNNSFNILSVDALNNKEYLISSEIKLDNYEEISIWILKDSLDDFLKLSSIFCSIKKTGCVKIIFTDLGENSIKIFNLSEHERLSELLSTAWDLFLKKDFKKLSILQALFPQYFDITNAIYPIWLLNDSKNGIKLYVKLIMKYVQVFGYIDVIKLQYHLMSLCRGRFLMGKDLVWRACIFSLIELSAIDSMIENNRRYISLSNKGRLFLDGTKLFPADVYKHHYEYFVAHPPDYP